MDNTNLTQEIAELHAKFCRGLADPTRLLILYLLAEQASNVSELTQKLAIPQPTVSRHLRVLRDVGLARATRQGMTVVYELADTRIIEALDLLRATMRDRIQYRANLMEEITPPLGEH
jgi:DNA-binding transcriptional ArsR family regulator